MSSLLTALAVAMKFRTHASLVVACALPSGTPPSVPTILEDVGSWEPVTEIDANTGWPLAMHAVHLPTGVILAWYLDPDDPARPACTWDPLTHLVTRVPTALAKGAAGHAALSDGSVLVAGGEVGGLASTNLAAKFTANGWRDVADMARTRWKPSCTTLASGKVIALAGTTTPGACATAETTAETFDPATGKWTALTPTPPGPPASPCSDAFSLCAYPWTFVMPSGNLFYAGGTSSLSTWQLRFDVTPPAWACVDASNWVGSPYGAAVIYQRAPANAQFGPPGDIEVFKCGGVGTVPGYIQDDPVPLAEKIDLSVASPQWENVSFLWDARIAHNLVELPNGRLLAVGGMSSDAPACFVSGGCSVLTPEWLDPNAVAPDPVWTKLADALGERGYHSTALLLLDGSVFVAGGEGPSAHTAEIFKPPYLFHGNTEITDTERAIITSAPAVIGYDQTFNVALGPNPPLPYRKVTLVRLGATTHGFDQNQRLLSLTYIVHGGPTLVVRSPANANVAPPGYYMLFVVTGDTATGGGIPSRGRYIRLQ